MEVMGQKVHSRSFVKDGFAYSVDFVQKTATKTKMSGFPVGLAFANLSKDIEEKMNLKKLGKETINGYECEKMSFDYKEMSTKGTVWTYKGVALKQEISAMGMEVKMEPVSFEEKQVDRAIFEVPADIKVTEHNVDLNKIGE